MSHTLRTRVLLFVFLLNASVFAAGGLFLLRVQITEHQRLEQDRIQELLTTIRDEIRIDDVNVARILLWSNWQFFQDAILVDRSLERTPGGGVDVPGVWLNPVGLYRRPAGFDRTSALLAIDEAIRTRSPVEGVGGGRAVPIPGPATGVWGGLWFKSVDRVDRAGLFRRLLTWFVLSTLFLTLGTFVAVRRMVLEPVELLASGARRVRGGDFTVRLAEEAGGRPRGDELTALVHAFDEMTSTVQSFHEGLEEKVEEATAKARHAEAAAMTQRRLAAMGELAAGIAHEINNPLGGLLNAVEALRRSDLTPEKRAQYLGLLANGLERIGETVNRLRRFTPRDAPHEPVALDAVARDAVELVAHRAERLGCEVVYAERPAGASFTLRGARNELGQAVLNLLANSIDALEEHGTQDAAGPRVEVTLEATPDELSLSVRDNGPGVPRDELPRVADLFYTTKEVGKGTGLGLSLVHNATVHHRGTVTISSEAGRYFQVELRFPRAGRRPDGEEVP